MISRYKKQTTYFTLVWVSVVPVTCAKHLTSATSVRPYKILVPVKLEFPIYCY